MQINESLICPKCRGTRLAAKREATYLYTYELETPVAENQSKYDETLPFLFDNRELVDSKEYLECQQCGTRYPYDFDKFNQNIHFTILQKAIRADHQVNPEYLG